MLKYILAVAGLLALNSGFAQERSDSLLVGGVDSGIAFPDLFLVSSQPDYGLFGYVQPNFKTDFGWKGALLSPVFQYRFGVTAITSAWPTGLSNPFFSGFSVNSLAHYQLNERLSLTGSSFSANSVFNPIQSFDPVKMNIQGINFYLEYKVSDKFRIGGGVQVNRNSSAF